MSLDLVGQGVRIVIPSVFYSDFLAVTLPAWRALFREESLVVVTSPEDLDSQDVATKNRAGLLVTKAWQTAGHRFDKAAALDEAFGFAGKKVPRPKIGEHCLSIDADVYPFGTLPEGKLRKDTIYGCPRYACSTRADLEAHARGLTRREELQILGPRRGRGTEPELRPGADPEALHWAGRACLGFFQLFRYTGQRFGSFNSAGKYDIEFRRTFKRRQGLDDFYVLHLGESTRRNWKGRVVPAWEATA